MQKLSLCRRSKYHSGLTFHFILSVPGEFPSHNWEDEIKKQFHCQYRHFKSHWKYNTSPWISGNPANTHPSDAACRPSFGDAWCRRTATQRRLLPSDIHSAREKKKGLTHQWQLHPFHLLFSQVLEVVVVVASAWNQCLHSQHRNRPRLHLTRQETRPHVEQIIKQNQAPFQFILSQTWWHRPHSHLVTRLKLLPVQLLAQIHS